MKIKIVITIIVSIIFIGCVSDIAVYQTKVNNKFVKAKKINKKQLDKNITLEIDKQFNQKIDSLAYKPINPNSMNFIKKGDVVIDKDRKLMWQDDKSLNSQKKMDWQQARKYCKNLNLAGHKDWRLPTIQELSMIIDLNRYNPAIAKEFKNVKSDWYWTNTSYANYSHNAWRFNFKNGYDHNYNKNNGNFVRCVRKIK